MHIRLEKRFPGGGGDSTFDYIRPRIIPFEIRGHSVGGKGMFTRSQGVDWSDFLRLLRPWVGGDGRSSGERCGGGWVAYVVYKLTKYQPERIALWGEISTLRANLNWKFIQAEAIKVKILRRGQKLFSNVNDRSLPYTHRSIIFSSVPVYGVF